MKRVAKKLRQQEVQAPSSANNGSQPIFRGRTRSPYWRLLQEDSDLRRWYDNLCRGSKITASVYLRRLGFLCNSRSIHPQQLVKNAMSDERWSYNFLMDLVTDLEKQGKAGSYIESNCKAVKSWLAHNGVQVVGRIKIRGASDTPTLRDKDALTGPEQALLFSTASSQTRCASVLMLEAGLRPESIGNYEGGDGLKLSDLPELGIQYDGSGEARVSFLKVPTIITVRRELSKARHQYFTFLPAEGCQFITEYLIERTKQGERLDSSSPLLTPRVSNSWRSKNRFVRTTLLGRIISKRLSCCKINARPYDLRTTFATRLMLAESKGLMIRDYRVFFMGHKGDIEARYTTNKNTLPQEVIEDMRSGFARAQKYLVTNEFSSREEDDIPTRIRTQILLTVGYKQEEIDRLRLAEMSDEEIQDMLRRKLFAALANNGQRQRIVSASEVEKSIEEGWEWIGNLADGRAILRLPLATM